MSLCKKCGAEIAWAFDPDARGSGWRPVDPRSLNPTSDEPYEGSVFLEDWHAPHKCMTRRSTGTQRKDDPEKQDGRFTVLHLLPSAPPEVVDAAYRAMAKIFHPDAGGATNDMQRINAAYDAIKQNKRGAW